MPLFAHLPYQCAAARRTTRQPEQFTQSDLQLHATDIGTPATLFCRVITRAANTQYLANEFHGFMRSQSINQFERLISSDTKCAVAFCKIEFSRSCRLILASSSWILSCSSVNASALGTPPLRSNFTCSTQRRRAVSRTSSCNATSAKR